MKAGRSCVEGIRGRVREETVVGMINLHYMHVQNCQRINKRYSFKKM